MKGGPYREEETDLDSEVLRIIDERDKYRKKYQETRGELLEYKMKVFFWIFTPIMLLVSMAAMYWCLLLDFDRVNQTMEHKHVCDPTPQCEFHLKVPDSSHP